MNFESLFIIFHLIILWYIIDTFFLNDFNSLSFDLIHVIWLVYMFILLFWVSLNIYWLIFIINSVFQPLSHLYISYHNDIILVLKIIININNWYLLVCICYVYNYSLGVKRCKITLVFMYLQLYCCILSWFIVLVLGGIGIVSNSIGNSSNIHWY